MNKPDLEIVPLTPSDAGELSAMLCAARPEYAAHFHPFAFDEETVRRQLDHARRDRYWAIRSGGELAGFFMLRGFDEGYERPSFGVFIAERFAGRGLARRALAESIKWCEQNAVAEMMLKVYRENAAALRIYEEAGFTIAETRGNEIVMTKRLRQ
jgi:RimJ/RimL family protein N-acetyltransferase